MNEKKISAYCFWQLTNQVDQTGWNQAVRVNYDP